MSFWRMMLEMFLVTGCAASVLLTVMAVLMFAAQSYPERKALFERVLIIAGVVVYLVAMITFGYRTDLFWWSVPAAVIGAVWLYRELSRKTLCR